MRINQSTPLKLFKKEVRQANHMLIIILVVLDGIKKYAFEADAKFIALLGLDLCKYDNQILINHTKNKIQKAMSNLISERIN